MMTPELLAAQWLDLFDTKVSKPIQQKQFVAAHKKLMDELAQLEPEDQQIFAVLINKGVKRSLERMTKNDEP